METFKRPTNFLSFLINLRNNLITTIISVVVLSTITAFISVEKKTTKNLLNRGVVFEVEVTSYDQLTPQTETTHMAVEGPNLKINILSSEGEDKGGEMIFKGDKGENGEFVVVDDDKKEYFLIDDAFVNSMIGKTKQSKTMVNDALKHLTPEQRKKIEDALEKSGTKMPGYNNSKLEPEIRKTSENKLVLGYQCIKYEVFLDNKLIRELWMSHWKEIDGGDEARDAIFGLNKFFQSLKDKIGEIPGSPSFFDSMNFENGFPVITTNFDDDGNIEDESKLRSVKRRTLDPEEFEPPSGYKRRSMIPGY